MNKTVYIFGGGTVAHIANHFAVCAPAYGKTARQLSGLVAERFNKEKPTVNICEEFTRMAGGKLETNEDVLARVNEIKKNSDTRIIFFNCALVDWTPTHYAQYSQSNQYGTVFSKYHQRLETKNGNIELIFNPAGKIISTIRTGRKDIFLVGFKTTCGASKQEMYEKGLNLCKNGSVNLVLVNDTKTRWNMIVTPEEAAYHETQDRMEALKNLVDMTYLRSHLNFTQSTVISGTPVSWEDSRIPDNLRKVINFCIGGGAYKEFNGSTVGHFAVRLSDTEFLTSIRRSNFNDIAKNGMVFVKTDGPDTVIACGQSQRIVFRNHPGYDCIVHFHCPLKPKGERKSKYRLIPVVSQREFECGSHECGKNTSDGLYDFDGIKAVMLDKHGPNIVFSKTESADKIIDFIKENFELSEKTGGYNL